MTYYLYVSTYKGASRANNAQNEAAQLVHAQQAWRVQSNGTRRQDPRTLSPAGCLKTWHTLPALRFTGMASLQAASVKSCTVHGTAEGFTRALNSTGCTLEVEPGTEACRVTVCSCITVHVFVGEILVCVRPHCVESDNRVSIQ